MFLLKFAQSVNKSLHRLKLSDGDLFASQQAKPFLVHLLCLESAVIVFKHAQRVAKIQFRMQAESPALSPLFFVVSSGFSFDISFSKKIGACARKASFMT